MTLAVSSAMDARAADEATYRFNIERQSLRTAVPQFARQAGGLQFALPDDGQAERIQVNRVSGRLTRSEALHRMLASTEVGYRMARPDLIVFQFPPRRDEVSAAPSDRAKLPRHS